MSFSYCYQHFLQAKLLSEVRHPNIVSYRESFQGDDGFLYIVMAFCEGGDMYSRLKAQKGAYLEERQIVEWFVQIAMALQVPVQSSRYSYRCLNYLTNDYLR